MICLTSAVVRPSTPASGRAAVGALTVRQISPRFLVAGRTDRIADLRHAAWVSVRSPTRARPAPSTVSRELRRNATGSRGYRTVPKLIGVRPPAVPVVIGGALRPTRAPRTDRELLLQRWSPQQSPVICRRFRTTRRCGCVTRASIKSVYQPGSTLLRPSPLARTVVRRFAPAATTGVRIRRVAPGRGSSSRCSRSISGRSGPRTVPRQALGRRSCATRSHEWSEASPWEVR